MLSFLAQGAASFSFETDFSEFNYANVSFFDAARTRILFHLSLRFEAGLAVANRRTGKTWHGEIPGEVTLARTGDRIAILFWEDGEEDGEENGTGVAVEINGHRILAFTAEEFPDLDAIAQVNFRGALVDDSIRTGGAANQTREGQGALTLDDRLTLSGWAVDPGLPRQTPLLIIDGLDEPILFDRVEAPEVAARHKLADAKVGITALLPGRVWEAVPEGAGLVIRLTNNGIACGAPLTLTRREVAGRIAAMAAAADLQRDTLPLITALEHVRFGRLWEDLPGPARRVLTEAAELYGLKDYLTGATRLAGEGTQTVPVPEMPAPSPGTLLVDRLLAEFGTRLAAGGSPAPADILRGLLARHPLGPGPRRQLFLAVTEAFCNADAFADLYALAAAQGLAGVEPNGGAWHDSVILPYLCMGGELDRARRIMWQLTERKDGWVATPALAWSLRWLFDPQAGTPVDEKVREDFLYAFLALLKAEAASYWGRSACVALMEAGVALMEAGDSLTQYAREELERTLIAAYGLSRQFWTRLRAAEATGRVAFSGRMQLVSEAFGQIEAQLEGDRAPGAPGPEVAAALDVLAAQGVFDAERFRLELFGPAGSGLPAGDALLPDLMRRPAAVNEGLLRAFAFPRVGAAGAARGASPLADETVRAVRAAVRAANPGPGTAPYYRQQIAASRAVTALLAAMQGGKPADPGALGGILRRLEILSSARSGHVGIGMALTLLERLDALGDDEAAMRVLTQLTWVLPGLPEASRHGLHAQPAVHAALTGLARQRRAGSPAVTAALRMFPNFETAALRLPEAPDAGLVADPWFDTIVTVFSCRPFLETRVGAMRAGWLGQLEALGIPYVAMVGDGDGRREGDVVHLDAPDDYEGLPQKTLAAARWVLENTPFAHMLKIDDDCFLDPGEFFHSQSYRKFDYYGRRLSRVLGQMDRAWHNAKSTSARGRLELDKSPEPSEYCDGGSAYTLSRTAMAALDAEAGTPEGRALVAASFMEDKMVGDLLARAGIAPANEDYHVAVQRRTHAGAVPVSIWENGFHPSRLAGIKQVHLDTHERQAEVLAHLEDDRLRPSKIWPSWAPVRLGYETNIVELVSDEARLAGIVDAGLAVVGCLRNEMFMLPHFLAHYRRLGVGAFLMIDNCSDDGSREYLLEQPDVALFSADTSYGQSHYGVAWQQALLAAFRVGRWTLLADADELLVYRGWEKTPLARHLAGKGFAGADAVRICMLDMYPRGPLSEATFESGDPFAEAGFADAGPFLRASLSRGPYSNAPTVTSALRHRLIPGSGRGLFVAQKYALLRYRPWMRLSQGLHYMAEAQVAEEEMIFAHFKYNAHFRAKAEAEVARGEHFNDAEEYRKYLALASEGREVIFDEAVSRPWREVDEVRRILGK